MDFGRILFIKPYQIHRISKKLTTFRVSQAPPQPNTMRQTKYLDPKASHETKSGFCKNHFFAEFFTFIETSKSKNPRSDRSGDVHLSDSANTPKSIEIWGPYARRKNWSRRQKIPENWKFNFVFFHLPKSSEKNTRHSESAPGTNCSVLTFFPDGFLPIWLLTFRWAREVENLAGNRK